MAALDEIDKRVRGLEVDRGVWVKTNELEIRVRDLESMVRTARYVVSVCAGLIALVGIGVTWYVSSLTSQFATANAKLDEAKAFVQKTQADLANTQAEIDTEKNATDKLVTKTQGLNNTFDNLVKDAQSRLKESAGSEATAAVANAATTLLSPISALQTKTNDAITTLNNNIDQIKTFAPISFTKEGCKVGKELGVLFALHDSNVLNPSSMGFLLTGGPNAAGLTNHDWAQMHVCQW